MMQRSNQYGMATQVASALLAVWLLAAACVGAPSPGGAAATPTFPNPPTAEATATTAAYPPPATVTEEETSEAYPAPTEQSTLDAALTPTSALSATEGAGAIYLPYIGGPAAPAAIAQASTETATPTPEPTATATTAPSPTAPPAEALGPAPSPTPINVVDFAAASAELAAQGQQLAYNKIGFHVTFLEEADQLDGWMQRLDAEGVPFFLKSVDNAEPLYKAQELMKVSGVPHTLVYRSTEYDVPDYNLDPVLAAEAYWELEKALWPPELDPGLIWFETMNELDKTRSEWLAQFSLRTAQLALRDGYKWAAFGWASGEPEPSDWESPAMLELLRLIGQHPDQLAIALHEYSYLAEDIGDDYPHKLGRFLDLFRVADAHGIPRPTVLITEWGWTYDNIPPEPLAMEDVSWAARLYGAYPQVKGAAIWNLGKLGTEYGQLNTQAAALIDNMLAFSLDSYSSAPLWPQQAPLDAAQFPPPAE
jgi:hypothetical protein